MIAILGGLGAACLWATANLASSRSSRIIGASSTVAWMMLVGLVAATPFAVVSGPLPALTPTLAVWLTASGVGGVIGLMLVYRGLRIGKIGVVLALASTEGAIAAVFAVIAGESLNVPTAAVLGIIAIGVATVALSSGGTAEPDGEAGSAAPVAPALESSRLGAERRAAMFGALAAIAFGFSIYGTARIGMSLPLAVAVLPARVVGVACVFVPMALSGRLRMTRRAVPMVVIVGLGEVLGNASYVLGARESIAIASVLASQFAAVAAVAAFLLFRERLSFQQRSGFVAIALGVAVLTVARG
jgi:drug/metabolite transporter (DMT)-like permease